MANDKPQPESEDRKASDDISPDFLRAREGLTNPGAQDNQAAGKTTDPRISSSGSPRPASELGPEDPVYPTSGNEPSDERGQAIKDAGRKARKAAPGSEELAQREEAGDTVAGGGRHENQVGRGWSQGQPNLLGRARNRFGKISTRWKVGGSLGLAGVVIAVIFGLLSFLPFELNHIKHIATDTIGGVEGRTYTIGRKRLYSTQFFFDKNNKNAFDGFKVGGIRQLMFENRKTNTLVGAMRDEGYEINFGANGKIASLKAPDGTIYQSNSEVERAWSLKKSGDLDGILRQVFPDKSDFWYNGASKALYKRWGLTRTNWLKDYTKKITGVTALEQKELAFRSALRDKLFGSGTGQIQVDPAGKPQDKNNPTVNELTNQSDSQLTNEVGSDALNLEQSELKDPTVNNPASGLLSAGVEDATSPDAIKKELTSSISSAVSIESLNALNASQKVCQAKRTLNDVVVGARVLRAAQLMNFAMSVLNIADAMENGQSVDSSQLSAMMNYLNTKDANGRTLWASSGLQYWLDPNHGPQFSSYDKNERDYYSVGGGFTGTLAGIKQRLDKYPLAASCSVVNNGWVSFGGLFAGLTLGVLSGGTFTASDVAFNVGISVAVGYAISTAQQILTPMVAGTIINGTEQGTGIGNALASGIETLVSAEGADTGMRPLTTGQAKVALAEVQADQKAQLANTGILARLFSPNQDHSLTSAAAMSTAGASVASLTSSPISSLGNIFHLGSLFSTPAYAATSSLCKDADLNNHDIATTPFCNPIMGIPDDVLNGAQFAPDLVDQAMSCIDNDGNPVAGCTPQVDTDGNPLPGTPYLAYVTQCTADLDQPGVGNGGIDVLHNDNNQGSNNDNSGSFTDTCINTGPQINGYSQLDLFNMYHLYLTAAQGENAALTGNVNTDSNPATAVPTSNPTATAPTGSAQQLAQQIQAAAKAGKIHFAVVNPDNETDGSTAEQNIDDVASGHLARTSTTCLGNGVLPPNATTTLDPTLLEFIVGLSQVQAFTINELAGGCHDESDSNHYAGKAVDIGCPFDPTEANSIGAKYNISDQTGESCSSGAGHFHYSIGGH